MPILLSSDFIFIRYVLFFVSNFLFISFSSTAFQNHRDQILNPDRTPTKPTTTVASVATATLPLQPTNVSNVPTSVAQLQFPTQPVSPNPAQMVAQLPREYIGLFLFNICFILYPFFNILLLHA